MKKISQRAVVVTWVVLLVLWGSSWGLSYAHLGAYAPVVALGIASVKAALVVCVFMEIVTERFSIAAAAVSALFFLALLAGLTAADVRTREQPDFIPPDRAAVAK